jgi:hypothetical protein
MQQRQSSTPRILQVVRIDVSGRPFYRIRELNMPPLVKASFLPFGLHLGPTPFVSIVSIAEFGDG